MLSNHSHFPNPLLPPRKELLRRVEDDEVLPTLELRLLFEEELDLLTDDLLLPNAPLRDAALVRAAMARLDFIAVMDFGA